ncbi:hypothetical protein K438DRAFT_1774446 [Mycena galopus ATCC 62051]|nr:hypothetical protein K438DRAFT_1774446 [Mycena galopus ATCC 62051]
MHLCLQLLRHIKRSLTLPFTLKKQSDNGEKSERKQSLPQNDKKSQPLISTETRRTASNALYFALQTLSSISNNVPVAGALSAIIEPLLDITSRIKQSSDNAQGLIQLATRIERLTPIVEEMAKSRELASMATDLKAASERGQLNQFFNSADNALALSKHNMVLAEMIADSTEVLKTLRELEALNDSVGGVGGTGGHAQIGGEGGEGDGPQLDIDPDDRYQIGNVSGGTGGAGGIGVEVGGKGGIGKGPVISMRRSTLRS